jgi:hypothetical protein
MSPMDTAPQDGTRILIKRHVRVFIDYGQPYARRGTQIIECWWSNGKWREWCGTERASSTDWIDPISWTPKPEGAA